MSEDKEQEHLEKSAEVRDAMWAEWGEVDPYVLSHLINPAFMGGPAWPALRQAFKIVRSDGRTLVASCGLSDPFDDLQPPVNGFELEVFAIGEMSAEAVVQESWIYDLTWQFAQFCASHGGVGPLLDDLGVLSSELYDVRIPDAHRADFVNEHGRVGILVGSEVDGIPKTVQGSLSEIRLVSVQILRLDELQHVMANGEQGRLDIAERLRKAHPDGTSRLDRPSVV